MKYGTYIPKNKKEMKYGDPLYHGRCMCRDHVKEYNDNWDNIIKYRTEGYNLDVADRLEKYNYRLIEFARKHGKAPEEIKAEL